MDPWPFDSPGQYTRNTAMPGVTHFYPGMEYQSPIYPSMHNSTIHSPGAASYDGGGGGGGVPRQSTNWAGGAPGEPDWAQAIDALNHISHDPRGFVNDLDSRYPQTRDHQ